MIDINFLERNLQHILLSSIQNKSAISREDYQQSVYRTADYLDLNNVSELTSKDIDILYGKYLKDLSSYFLG